MGRPSESRTGYGKGLRRRSRAVGFHAVVGVVAAVAALGCAGPTIPTVAVAGTTIGIPIGGEEANANGTGVAYGAPGISDPQRGALRIDLMSGSTVAANLPLRLVTRVMPDPSSPAGLGGFVTTPGTSFPVPWIQQVVALVDVPLGLDGTYTVRIERYRDATYAQKVDDGPEETHLWALTVRPGDGNTHYTPFRGWWPIHGTSDVEITDLSEIVPYPKLILNLPVSGGQPVVGAATIDVNYPLGVMDVVGVAVHNSVEQTPLVSFEEIDADTVRIHYVNPRANARSLELIFENTQTSYSPIAASAFTVAGAAYYDANGSPVTPAPSFNPIGQIR